MCVSQRPQDKGPHQSSGMPRAGVKPNSYTGIRSMMMGPLLRWGRQIYYSYCHNRKLSLVKLLSPLLLLLFLLCFILYRSGNGGNPGARRDYGTEVDTGVSQGHYSENTEPENVVLGLGTDAAGSVGIPGRTQATADTSLQTEITLELEKNLRMTRAEVLELKRRNEELQSQVISLESKHATLKKELVSIPKESFASDSSRPSRNTEDEDRVQSIVGAAKILGIPGLPTKSETDPLRIATQRLVPYPSSVKLNIESPNKWPLFTGNIQFNITANTTSPTPNDDDQLFIFEDEENEKSTPLQTALSWFRTKAAGITGIPVDFAQNSFKICHEGMDQKAYSHCEDPPPVFKIDINCPSCPAAYPGNTKASPPPKVTTDENYELTVTSSGVLITTSNLSGTYRALATLLQLILPISHRGENSEAEKDSGYYVAGVSISDSPRFPWRGLMVDVSRHFVKVPTLRRIIDACAMLKLNTLHLHLADDQGWRFESLKYPMLTGSNSTDGHYYTQDTLKELVKFAGEKGIRIVPEIDIPGHSTALLNALPEISEKYRNITDTHANKTENSQKKTEKTTLESSGRQFSGTKRGTPQRTFGVFSEKLDFAKEETARFMADIIEELTEVFPDRYIHLGGDEVFSGSSATRKRFFKLVLGDVLTYLKRAMIGWDELLDDEAFQRGSIVQVWRGKAPGLKARKNILFIVWSEGYYLDLLKPASEHYLADPLGENPSRAQIQTVIGGEACMWSELVSDETIESRLWPRAAAVAERLWSPAKLRNVKDMYRRIQYLPEFLELSGSSRQLANSWKLLLRMACGDANVAFSLGEIGKMFRPLGLRERNSPPRYTTLTPLTKLVDAIPAESRRARELTSLVSESLRVYEARGSPGAPLDKAQHLLGYWLWHAERLSGVLADGNTCRPLKEVFPIIRAASEAAKAGYVALGHLNATSTHGGRGEDFKREINRQTDLIISGLKAAVTGIESASEASELQCEISGPLRTISAALGGGDAPSGRYQGSCQRCEHSASYLRCECDSRSGSAICTSLSRPYDCDSSGIDNQDGYLVCVRHDGTEAKAEPCAS